MLRHDNFPLLVGKTVMDKIWVVLSYISGASRRQRPWGVDLLFACLLEPA
ncbi:hypothetical protein OS190_17185 [Sulfitobacter sp. F26204]|nr:hypothetical protein [Sulfitobacter sp. F26204]MCX7561304.1 hypothetical protein [Sulfitobacter sp. F26204]